MMMCTLGITLWQVLKTFNSFSLLENETMEMFSVTVRNEGKHKFAGTKVCETVEEWRIFNSLNSKWRYWLVRYQAVCSLNYGNVPCSICENLLSKVISNNLVKSLSHLTSIKFFKIHFYYLPSTTEVPISAVTILHIRTMNDAIHSVVSIGSPALASFYWMFCLLKPPRFHFLLQTLIY